LTINRIDVFKIPSHRARAPRAMDFLPAVCWFILVCLLLFMPSREMPDSNLFKLKGTDKLVHLFLFGVMTFLFCLPVFLSLPVTPKNKKIIYWSVALLVSLWGLSTEFIQKTYVPGRDFELLDWLADSAGSFLAYIPLHWVLKNQSNT
jgi:hypothetical protein